MKLNQNYIIGFLTRDAETRKMKNGAVRQDFTIAINDDYKKKDSDEWTKRAYYINCFTVGKTYDGLNKGVKVIIDGKLVQRNYEVDGQKKSYIGVEVYTLDFLKEPEKKVVQPQLPVQEESKYVIDEAVEPDEEIPF